MTKVCPRCRKEFEVSEENRMPRYEVIIRENKKDEDYTLSFRDRSIAEDCCTIYENMGYFLVALKKIVFTDNGDKVELLRSNTDVAIALVDNDDGTPVDTEICPRCEIDEDIADAWVAFLKEFTQNGKRRQER